MWRRVERVDECCVDLLRNTEYTLSRREGSRTKNREAALASECTKKDSALPKSELIYLLGTLVICNINKLQTTYFRSPFCESTLHVISIDDLLLFSPSYFPRVYKPPALRSLRPGASLSPSTTFERSSSCPLYSAKKHTRLLFS